MAPRLDLQALLVYILGTDNVYFQPPPSKTMQYPAIVYNREDVDTQFADNLPYSRMKRYNVTVIDRNPDSDIPDKIGALPMCRHDRFYAADNLNHDAFTLYF